jgi:hypothetical protein
VEVAAPDLADVRAKLEAEVRAQLEAEAEEKIARAVATAVADVKCKMDQKLAAAVAEAVADANRKCDVRCAAEVEAAVSSIPTAKTTWKAQPARIAIPTEAIFDAHVNKLMCRAQKKFDQFDYDGNGLLEGEELTHLGEWLWASFHPGEEASEDKKEAEGLKLLFRQDDNGDGALSFEEFEGWFRKTCVAIEKYRRGLSQKPNLKCTAPKKQKMPEPKPKPAVMSVAERIKAAEPVQLAPYHVNYVELSIHDTFIRPRQYGAPPAPMGVRPQYHGPAYGHHTRYSNFTWQ